MTHISTCARLGPSNKDAFYHKLYILLRVLDAVSKSSRIKLGMKVVALNQTAEIALEGCLVEIPILLVGDVLGLTVARSNTT